MNEGVGPAELPGFHAETAALRRSPPAGRLPRFVWAPWRRAADGLCDAPAGARFEVAGFSLGHARRASALGPAIAAARAASCNRRLAVVVGGGAALAAKPGLAAGLGADVCVADRDIAVHFPHDLLRALRL